MLDPSLEESLRRANRELNRCERDTPTQVAGQSKQEEEEESPRRCPQKRSSGTGVASHFRHSV
jgi:hypothetical protein